MRAAGETGGWVRGWGRGRLGTCDQPAGLQAHACMMLTLLGLRPKAMDAPGIASMAFNLGTSKK